MTIPEIKLFLRSVIPSEQPNVIMRIMKMRNSIQISTMLFWQSSWAISVTVVHTYVLGFSTTV